MRSIWANLRRLVLPTGQTSGRRIVLDGVKGRIEVYDLAGLLRIRLGVADAVELSSGDAAELFLADLQASIVGAGGARQLSVVVESPSFPGRDRALIDLLSESFDGSVDPLIRLRGRSVDVLPASIGGDTDLTIDGVSVPRGILAGGRYLNTAADDVARAPGTLTDMAVTVNVVAGRAYKVTLNSHVVLGTAGAVYAVDLWDGAATVGRFGRPVPAETVVGSTVHYMGMTVDYFPTVSGAVTLTVRNANGSGGTIAMQRQTPGYRSLTISDN